MNTALNGFKFVKRIAIIDTNDTNDYVLLFRNANNEIRLSVWSTNSAPHKVSIPSDKCQFDVVHYKGSPAESAQTDGPSLALTLSDTVDFITAKCKDNKALNNAPEAYHIVVEPQFKTGHL